MNQGPSTTGNPFNLTVGATTTDDRFEFTHDGALNSDAFRIAGTKHPTLDEGTLLLVSKQQYSLLMLKKET